ncbi:MAG: multidrug ABC transporter ATP-binding protein, partial [Rhodospirillales bacterium]
MFRYFENLLRPTEIAADASPPVGGGRHGLLRFYLHFVRQARGPLAGLFAAGLAVALLDVTIPVMIGHVVDLVGRTSPEGIWRDNWTTLLGMAGVMLVLRPAALTLRVMLTNQAINVGLTNLVRWQNHWHVVRQSWSFFQNDFAGRIANRVMQTGPSLRESVVSATNAVWYIVVYGSSAVVLLASIDGRLAVPMLAWFVAYVAMLRH